MTVHSFDQAKVLGKYEREVSGSFFPNGSSAVDNSSNIGLGFTVARQSLGVFRVTLDFPFAAFKHVAPTLWIATGDADAHEVRVGDFSLASGYFEIEHLASAITSTTHPVAADLAADTTTLISFVCKVIVDDGPGSGVPSA